MRVSDEMEVGSSREQPTEESSVQTKMPASSKVDAGLSRNLLCLKVPNTTSQQKFRKIDLNPFI